MKKVKSKKQPKFREPTYQDWLVSVGRALPRGFDKSKIRVRPRRNNEN